MARPFSVFGAIPIDAPPTRTLCHGWSEPGAEVKPYQPKFCTAPGPSGPEGMKSGTVFCALELLRKGVGVSPVNGGPGEERLWAAKEVAPQGETCEAWRAESSRPTSVMVREGRAGQETRPYGVSGGSQQDRGMGRNAPAGRNPQQEQETGRPRAAGF